ncbi:hypothetical protein FHETE_1615 [Fusarium heterosporum]|uniref:Uncharacterized protein n=1 Tax=Fusarium heterosporum TaxID=42747 RepID=A0A8H5TYN3_FUSHE|nr:hypothetical protein FHETE_1615 [Fusarium heterosporum]
MDDLIAMASIMQESHTRWLNVISRINSPENIARQNRLKQLDVEIQNTLKFTREDTQGNVNVRPIRALFNEQSRLEEEIERDTKLYEQELHEARAGMNAASESIRLQSTPSAAQDYLQYVSIPTPSRSPPHPEDLEVQHEHEVDNEDDGNGDGGDFPWDSSDDIQQDRRSEYLSIINHNQLQVVPSSQRESPHIDEDSARSAKRARRDPSPRLFIDFNELFESRQPLRPTQIVQHPLGTGDWFILECPIHQLDFSGEGAIQDAMRHLLDDHPDIIYVNPPIAIKEMGVQVLDCNEELAERNNAVPPAINPIPEHGQEEPNSQDPLPTQIHPKKRKKRGRQKAPIYSWKTPKSFAEIHPSIVSLQPGDIVGVWVEKSKHFQPAMIIPWGRFGRFNYNRTLAQVELNLKIPKCYDGARSDDTSPRPWAPGYEDNGGLAHRRMLPGIYFRAEQDFPFECQSSWLALNKLKIFDMDCPYTIHKGAVQEYIECHEEYHQHLDQARGPLIGCETEQVSAGEPELKEEGEEGDGVWRLGRPGVRRAQIVRSVE